MHRRILAFSLLTSHFATLSSMASAQDLPPYVGSWDCEVATMTFTADTYDAGDGPQMVRKVEVDGSAYHLFMDNDYSIWVSLDDNDPDRMSWLSDASGDSFSCKRVEDVSAAPEPEPAQAPAGDGGAELRCGWIVNPTPGNWWLTDRDGTWVMAFQGSDTDPGMDKIGDISAGDYVATNGSYGYACGCMKVVVNTELETVVNILSFKQKPIAACEGDKSLPAPE